MNTLKLSNKHRTVFIEVKKFPKFTKKTIQKEYPAYPSRIECHDDMKFAVLNCITYCYYHGYYTYYYAPEEIFIVGENIWHAFLNEDTEMLRTSEAFRMFCHIEGIPFFTGNIGESKLYEYFDSLLSDKEYIEKLLEQNNIEGDYNV